MGPQDLHGLLLIVLMGNQETASLLTVRAGLVQFRGAVPQFVPDRAHVRRAWQYTHTKHNMSGTVQLQGHIQGRPRFQSGPPRPAVLFALEPGQFLQGLIDFL